MKARRYRLLIFRSNMLEEWLELEAGNDLDAVKTASAHPSDDRLEVWRGDRRIAVLRPPKAQSLGRALAP